MSYRISDKDYDALTFDLDWEIQKYKQAREDHKFTENVPAPTTYPLVEEIVRRHNGEYEIAVTKDYIRIVDNVIVDKRSMAVPPIGADWVLVTRPDQLMNHYWDEESQAWIKPGTKTSKIESVENENRILREQLEVLKRNMNRLSRLIGDSEATEGK